MALTPSTMLPLGTAAPDFALRDAVSGATKTLADFAPKKALAPAPKKVARPDDAVTVREMQ